MSKAVFFDRDGTLVAEAGYAARPEQMEPLPGVAQALKRIGDAGYLRLVVTNQSGIARGYFDAAVVEALNRELTARLEREGAGVEDFAHCPHHPNFSGSCNCRSF